MRIVTLAWGSFEKPAGTELGHLQLCRGLAAKGHEVFLLYEEDGPLLAEWQKFTSAEVRLEGYTRDLWTPLRSTTGLLRAARTAASFRPDCLYMSFPVDAWLGRLGALPNRANVFCHLHLPYLGGASWFLKTGSRTVTRFVAASQATAESWRSVVGGGASRIVVVHNGVDPTRFRPPSAEERAEARRSAGVDDDDFVVLFAGRLDPDKGIDVLVKAMRRVTDDERPFRLVAVGKPKDEAFMASLRAASSDLPVSWLGWRGDILPSYWAADVVAVPSVWPEPFGLVVLEAMACGVPVVASEVGGVPEILEPFRATGGIGGVLVPPGDVEALAEGLRRTRQEHPDPAPLRGYVVENFSLGRAVDQLEVVLMGGRGS